MNWIQLLEVYVCFKGKEDSILREKESDGIAQEGRTHPPPEASGCEDWSNIGILYISRNFITIIEKRIK
jgi:hypothetical protein